MKIARREFGFGVRLAVPEGRDIYRSMPANRNSRAHLWATEGDISLRWGFGIVLARCYRHFAATRLGQCLNEVS